MTFKEFEFEAGVSDGLEAMGFEKPTPIQEMAIPHILAGKDLIGCAQTGTGKTAAFLLPIINKIEQNPGERIDTLIITPTRELANQIDQQLTGFSYFTQVSSMAVYGGGDASGFEQEKKALTNGVNIIVATPGKLIAHLNLGYVKLDQLKHVVLDEADRMLDMGFYEDITRIIRKCPSVRQTLMFSATMPPKIRDFARNILTDPEEVSLSISKPAAGILQGAYLTHNDQKIKLVQSLLKGKEEEYQSVIIFSSTKRNVKEINNTLRKMKMRVGAIHSDLVQTEREEVLLQFKNRKLQILVATDIVARGIDIKGISLVINYEVPGDAEDYVHRIGRTARADNTGVGLTFINSEDVYKFSRIEQLIETVVEKLKLPEGFGDGPEYNPKKGGGGRGRGGNYRGKGRSGGGNKRHSGGGGGRKKHSGGPKGQSGGGGNNSGGGSKKKSSGYWKNKKRNSGGGGQGQGGGSAPSSGS